MRRSRSVYVPALLLVCVGLTLALAPVSLPRMSQSRSRVCPCSSGLAPLYVQVLIPCTCFAPSVCTDLDPLYVTVPTRVCAGLAPCVCRANSRACSGLAPSYVPVSLPCMPMFVRSRSPVCAGLDPVYRFRSPSRVCPGPLHPSCRAGRARLCNTAAQSRCRDCRAIAVAAHAPSGDGDGTGRHTNAG